MAQPYVGEIRMFAGNFPPVGWMFCDGQLLPISENETLFQLIGTTYGGDGQSTFALPNLQSRVPIHMGQGPGLSQNYQLAEQLGVEEVTLTVQQIPLHSHPMTGTSSIATQRQPVGASPAQTTGQVYASRLTPVNASPQAIGPVGGSQPHTNLQPYLCVNFIISLFGLFPNPT
jgi:microcystin-dependent protein